MWVKCLIGVLSKCSQHQKIQCGYLLCVKDAWTKQHTRNIKWFEWSVCFECYRNALSISVSNIVTCCFQMLHKKVLFRKWTEHFLESFWLHTNTDQPVFPHNGFMLSDEQPPFANNLWKVRRGSGSWKQVKTMAFNKSDVVNIYIIIANTKSGRSSKGFSASSDSFVFMTACWGWELKTVNCNDLAGLTFLAYTHNLLFK